MIHPGAVVAQATANLVISVKGEAAAPPSGACVVITALRDDLVGSIEVYVNDEQDEHPIGGILRVPTGSFAASITIVEIPSGYHLAPSADRTVTVGSVRPVEVTFTLEPSGSRRGGRGSPDVKQQ